MAIHVSLVSRKDLKGEIYRQLRAAIRTGQLRAGEYLTPSRELAEALAVSRSTLVAAYDRRAAEGFVTSRPGTGTVVSDGLAHPGRGAIRPFCDLGRRCRAQLSMSNIVAEPAPSSAESYIHLPEEHRSPQLRHTGGHDSSTLPGHDFFYRRR
jgi:GntR family transcriptional regulator / MocR family aminotransferase